jgi:hypothetical protein
LVVANLERDSFEYIDSLDYIKYLECARTMAANLKEYLGKHGIDARTWSLSNILVMKQKTRKSSTLI